MCLKVKSQLQLLRAHIVHTISLATSLSKTNSVAVYSIETGKKRSLWMKLLCTLCFQLLFFISLKLCKDCLCGFYHLGENVDPFKYFFFPSPVDCTKLMRHASPLALACFSYSTQISDRPDFWKVVQSVGHLIALPTTWCLAYSRQKQIDAKWGKKRF